MSSSNVLFPFLPNGLRILDWKCPPVWQHRQCRTWETSRTKRILETIFLIWWNNREIFCNIVPPGTTTSQSFQLIDTVIHINDRCKFRSNERWALKCMTFYNNLPFSVVGGALNIYSISFSLYCSTEIWNRKRIQQHIVIKENGLTVKNKLHVQSNLHVLSFFFYMLSALTSMDDCREKHVVR